MDNTVTYIFPIQMGCRRATHTDTAQGNRIGSEGYRVPQFVQDIVIFSIVKISMMVVMIIIIQRPRLQ